ncbi:hypothetical protein [Candidatus Venteria ishoeyi]|uniref:Uncharacterized protein n=1 Tax=Candidatus Venteria ishoeyi TaxID=1899563 RepID=A0A1H6F717_9GAMM|nr:hypothetical protein [Candidatus Venteria ishoeyi]SEH05099.1 Uncharacterised protein [Candidatus Venteria ishoeyi]
MTESGVQISNASENALNIDGSTKTYNQNDQNVTLTLSVEDKKSPFTQEVFAYYRAI